MLDTSLKQKYLIINEREVVVYFQADFETHKFTVNRELEADISHVMSIDSLLFNLDVDLL